MRIWEWWIIGWITVGTPAWIFADPPPANQNTDSQPGHTDSQPGQTDSQAVLVDDGNELVQRLAHPNYSIRRHAMLELWGNHERYQKTVHRAAQSPDTEVAQRAKWISRQWRRGVLPSTPPDVSRQLTSQKSPQTIEPLLWGGHYQAVLIAIEEAAGTVNEERLTTSLRQELFQRFPHHAHQAVSNGNERALFDLIDRTADSPEMALCRLRMMQVLDFPINNDLLPANAAAWPTRKRTETIAMLSAYLGRWDDVIQEAQDREDFELVLRGLLATNRWDEATELALEQAEQAQPGSRESATWWSQTLHCAVRSGDADIVDQAMEMLSGDPGQQEPVFAKHVRRNALAAQGWIAEATAIKIEKQPLQYPFDDVETCLAGDRPEEALSLLGLTPANLAANLHQEIDEAIADQLASSDANVVPSVRRMISVMRVLIAVGDRASAWQVASRLSEVKLPEEKRSRNNRYRVRDAVIGELSRLGVDDWVVDLAIVDGENKLSVVTTNAVAETIPEIPGQSLGQLMQALKIMFPRWTLDRRLQSAIEMVRGNSPAGFDIEKDGQRLFDLWTARKASLTMSVRQRLLGQVRGTVKPSRANLNLEIVDTFFRLGRQDLAQTGLQWLVEAEDPQALMRMARQASERGDTRQAAKIYGDLVAGSAGRAAPTGLWESWRMVRSVRPQMLADAMVQRWQIAKTNGDVEQQQLLWRQIELMACGPTMPFNLRVASELAKRGQYDWGIQFLTSRLMMEMARVNEESLVYNFARELALVTAQRNPGLAAKWFDIALSQQALWDRWPLRYFVILPVSTIRWELSAAIAESDAVKADRAIGKLQRLSPIDINLAEEFVTPMREAGLEESADRLLAGVVEEGRRHIEKFPSDATVANNVAWLAALSDRQLPLALSLSKHAVGLEPDSAIFRDTLAEVLFRMDHREEALMVEEHCLLDESDMWHLHQQIERFADSETSMP